MRAKKPPPARVDFQIGREVHPIIAFSAYMELKQQLFLCAAEVVFSGGDKWKPCFFGVCVGASGH